MLPIRRERRQDRKVAGTPPLCDAVRLPDAPLKINQNNFRLGQSMSHPLFHDGVMKRYKTRYPRRSLLAVPYSVRPDRIERGLRILRALRSSLSASTAPFERPQQKEFDFPLPKRV